MTKYKNNSTAKRYYWLKLKNDFFDQKEIKLLRKIAGGDTYTIIYLKMLLKSLKDDGKLFYEAIGDDFAEELALDIDEDVENVQLTLSFLESKGLLEVVEEDEYFLNKVPEMLGSESYSAERMRRLRKNKMSQCDASTAQSDSCVTKRIDIEIDIDKEIDIDDDHRGGLDNTEIGDIEKSVFGKDLSSIIKVYESVLGLANPLAIESLEYWCNDLNAELVTEAIKRASQNNANSFKYSETILKNWEKQKIKTLDDVYALDNKFNKNKQSKRNGNRVASNQTGQYDELF